MARFRGPDREQQAQDLADAAVAAGLITAPELMRGLIHVIDHRTSPICLDLARRGQVVAIDEPWDTLLGEQYGPPFHAHCRTFVVPVIPGEMEPQEASQRDAEAEGRAREGEPEPPPRPSRTERRRRRRDSQRRRREENRRRREANRQRRRSGEPRQTARDIRGAGTYEPSTTVAPPVRPRRSSLREWLPLAREVTRVHAPGSGDDPAMRAILREQRWTGRPSVVPRGALGNLAVALLVWRGIAASAEPAELYAEQLRNGALVLGLGVAGVGIYAALSEPDAAQYAGPDGVVVRAGLPPEARVVDADNLVAERLAAMAGMSDREAAALRVIASDPGRLAAALGYDAVRFPDGTVLVVNRTALIVEEP